MNIFITEPATKVCCFYLDVLHNSNLHLLLSLSLVAKINYDLEYIEVDLYMLLSGINMGLIGSNSEYVFSGTSNQGETIG